jgi:hypothetical protein
VPVYADRSANDVNQGDIFEAVPFPVGRADGAPSWGMVISQDCDADKFLKPKTPLSDEQIAYFRLTVAHVHPLNELGGSWAKAVREDKMPRFLLMPEEGELPDLVVDLWLEQPVLMTDLLDCTRVASLSPEWRYKLWWKIVRLRLGEHYMSILRGEIPPDAA